MVLRSDFENITKLFYEWFIMKCAFNTSVLKINQ